MPPKRGKTGPPYTDIPSEVYVVVTHPWGMNPTPRERGQHDFNRVASWAQLVLQQAGMGVDRLATIECIYGMGTRDEIIIQFAEGTDIIPLIGEHRWANISRVWTGDPNSPVATCVFIYSWRNNGDPSKHNWTEWFPKPLPIKEVPAKSPYPAPSWVAPPSTLINFVQPNPRPANPPPDPPRNPPPEKEPESSKTLSPPQQTSQPIPPEQPIQEALAVAPPELPVQKTSVQSNLFRPYEKPSQYPSRIPPTHQPPVSPKAEPSTPPLKFVKKLDPYELDEDAFRVLREPEPTDDTNEAKCEDVKPTLPLSIKAEVPEVKLEYTLGDVRHDNSSSAASSLQPVPLRTGDYQPSAELAAEMNIFFHGIGAQPPSVTIKREYEEDATPYPAERKKVKIEQD